MRMATAIWNGVKKRPILVTGGLLGCTAVLMNKRKRDHPLPEGEIWLDMDLSRPLSKTKPGVNLSMLTGDERNPLTVRDVVDALEMAKDDDRVRGLLGRFNYRGWSSGGLACVQEVRDAVRQFRDSAGVASKAGEWGGERKKFTIAVADSFGEGSPAVDEYYLASAFEKVLIQKSGYVGLTGIGTQTLFFQRFFKKYGIKSEVFAREEYKSAASSFIGKKYSRPVREDLTSLLGGMIDDVADDIALSRGFKGRKDVRAIMNKCPLGAKDALAANLVDGVIYPHDAEDMVRNFLEGNPPLQATYVPVETPEDILENFPKDWKDFKALVAHAQTMIANAEDDTSPKHTRVPMADYVKHMRAKESKRGELATCDKKVAIINVGGLIVRDSQSQDMVTSSQLCERLRKASTDPTIGAIVMRVDSGGGSAVASDSIAAAVQRVRLAGKPVVCSMGDVAASGGYMIAAACDKIVAQPTTITGSIGVISMKLSIARLLADWGLDVDSIEMGENHLSLLPFQELTHKQRKLMDKRVGEIYEDFVSHVAEGRKLPVQKVLSVAKGRVWTGRQALGHGLVDQLGGLNEAISIAKRAADMPEEARTTIAFPEQPNFGQVFRRFVKTGRVEVPEGYGGVRGILRAFVEALVGRETVSSVSSILALVASANDVSNGKVPAELRKGSKVDAKLEDIDLW